MHVVDAFQVVVLLQGDGVEAERAADVGEGRGKGAERLHGGLGSAVLVLVEDRHPVAVGDRHDRALEPALAPGGVGALLGADGVGVDVLPAEALDGGDQVRTDALGHEVVVVGRGRVGEQRPAVGHHRHPRHRLHPAGQHQPVPAGADLLRGQVGGLQPGGAEPVNLHPADGVGQPGDQRRGLGEVAALVGDRGDDAEDQVVDVSRVEARQPGPQFVDQPDDEVDRLGRVQRPLLPAAAWCADRFVDVGLIAHDELSPLCCGMGQSARR